MTTTMTFATTEHFEAWQHAEAHERVRSFNSAHILDAEKATVKVEKCVGMDVAFHVNFDTVVHGRGCDTSCVNCGSHTHTEKDCNR